MWLMKVRDWRPFNLLSTSLPACFTVSIWYANNNSKSPPEKVKYCTDSDIIIRCKASTWSESHQNKRPPDGYFTRQKLKSNLSRQHQIKIECREHLFCTWERTSNSTVRGRNSKLITSRMICPSLCSTVFFRLWNCITSRFSFNTSS